jgi:glycylpeptide N-tetradecanoyltransferase
MAPVLIKEITRRFNVEGIYQAIYTAGVVLPAPVSSCRYFHRTLDTNKLIETGFSAVPRGTTAQRQALRNRLPLATALPDVRPMEEKDIDQVSTLLEKYLARFDMSQAFSKEEIRHWALPSPGQEQVVWSYVVEKNGKVTDFFSFYVLESTIIRQLTHGHKTIKAAYLYYYATDVVFENDEAKLKTRLNELIKDALILAKRVSDLAARTALLLMHRQNKFDVLNALTLMDNHLFLEEQKFGRGDGLLHYYLYNYRTSPIAGGTEAALTKSGVGIVML